MATVFNFINPQARNHPRQSCRPLQMELNTRSGLYGENGQGWPRSLCLFSSLYDLFAIKTKFIVLRYRVPYSIF